MTLKKIEMNLKKSSNMLMSETYWTKLMWKFFTINVNDSPMMEIQCTQSDCIDAYSKQ